MKYTIEEIDAMRDAILTREEALLQVRWGGSLCYNTDSMAARVETLLRTYMTAGISKTEVEASRDAALDELNAGDA